MWFWWMLIAIHALGGIANILVIGKKREPSTPGNASVIVLIHALLIWGIAHYGFRAEI